MTKQPAVYRTPRDPGFVGGYNWTAMLAGLLLLVLVNFAATQFIAYRFRYQRALGARFSDTARMPCTSRSRGHHGFSGMPVRQTLAFAYRC